jgi:putative oxidoreductase
MAVVHHIARPLLASVFISAGADTLLHPDKRAETAAPVIAKVRELVPALPDNGEAVVRLNAGAQLLAGLALASGRLPRLAALVLAGSLVPTTLGGHRFWEYQDPQERRRQRTHALKNMAILGGLLFAATDRGGSPSLGWRARRAVRKAAVPLP